MLKKYFTNVPKVLSLMLNSLIGTSAAYGIVFALKESAEPAKIIFFLLITVLTALAVMNPLLCLICKRLRRKHDLDSMTERYFSAVPLPLCIAANLLLGWAVPYGIFASLLLSCSYGPEIFILFLLFTLTALTAANFVLYLVCRAVRSGAGLERRKELTHTALRSYASVGAFVLMAAHLIVK